MKIKSCENNNITMFFDTRICLGITILMKSDVYCFICIRAGL
jgi:hypothetical protein